MKVIRITHWVGDKPVSAYIIESDLKISVYEAANAQRELAQQSAQDVDVQVHDVPGWMSLPEVTLHLAKRGLQRRDAEERHRDTLHDWLLSLFAKVSPEGVIATTRPAPLSAAALSEELTRVAENEAYKGQRVSLFSNDGIMVTLAGGKVTTLDSKPTK